MVRRYGLWIHGESVLTGDWEAIRNPYTGEEIAEASLAGEDEIEIAIQAAERGFLRMKALTRGERAEILHQIVNLLRRHRTEMANCLVEETGKPIDASLLELDRAIMTFRLSAEEALRSVGEVVAVDLSAKTKGYHGVFERFPLGPITAITPFNFPLNLSAHKIGPALAAGNSVLLKPPVQCPTLLFKFAELAHEAGVPSGALNVLHCKPPIAEKLVTDNRVKLINFTGSAAVGWHLKSILGKKRVLLELGGNAGVIVYHDANVPHAAKRLALGAFYQSGQVCISAQRIYVQNSIAEEFTSAFVKETQALSVGDPKQPGTVIGPMIAESAAQRVEDWIKEAIAAGAKTILEGRRHGTMMTPWILTEVPYQSKISCEEVFGPVVILDTYSEFDEALERVNDTHYGLQASVFTHDIRLVDRAFRTLEVGGVIVNDFPNFRTDNFPYGGVKDSGLGREGVRYAIEEMTEKKMLVVNLND